MITLGRPQYRNGRTPFGHALTRIAGGGLLGVALAGFSGSCHAVPQAPRIGGGQLYGATAGMTASMPRRVNLIASPKDIRSDVAYPPIYMRQKLSWSDQDMEWRMQFPSRRYAYGGVTFRHPLDLSTNREQTRLVFRVRPASLASFLSVALVDNPSNTPPVMIDVWLLDALPPAGDGWATVEIALTAFPSQGIPVMVGNDLNFDVARAFDWSRVRELRFVSNGGRIPSEEIVIKHVRLQR